MPEQGQPGQQSMSVEQAMQLAEAYQGQLEALEQQRQSLASVEHECKATRRALGDLGDAGKEDVMVPVGAGTFVHAQLTNTESVVTPIGAGVHVGMPIEEARDMLDKRAEDAGKARQELESTMDRLQTQLQDLVGQIRAVQQQGAMPGEQAGAAAAQPVGDADEDE